MDSLQYRVLGFTMRGRGRECTSLEEAVRIARAEVENAPGAPCRVESMGDGRVVWRDGEYAAAEGDGT
jgi:hypothetical protein